MEFSDISNLRVIASLQAAGQHQMARDIANDIGSPTGKAVAAILTHDGSGATLEQQSLADEILASIQSPATA